MQSVGLAITAIFLLIMAGYMAPNIMAFNRGKILRNVAIWLAIFLSLATVYRMMHPSARETVSATAPAKAESHDNNDGKEGFTPPKEE